SSAASTPATSTASGSPSCASPCASAATRSRAAGLMGQSSSSVGSITLRTRNMDLEACPVATVEADHPEEQCASALDAVPQHADILVLFQTFQKLCMADGDADELPSAFRIDHGNGIL